MTPTRRSFFASLAALAVAPKVLKPYRVADMVPSATAQMLLADQRPYRPSAFRYDDHETHLRMHLEDLRTGFEPMTSWDKANEYAWRRHIREHELFMERVSSKRDIEGGRTL